MGKAIATLRAGGGCVLSAEFYSALYSGEATPVFEPLPSNYGGLAPAPDFVLCRSSSGVATAIYGQDRWDFNPLRLSAKTVPVMDFSRGLESPDGRFDNLKNEAKFLVFCLVYFSSAGRMGALSVATLRNSHYILMSLAKYCAAQESKPLIGLLSLRQMLTTPVYLAAFMRDNQLGVARKKILRALLVQLVGVGEDRLGYRVQGLELEYGRFEFKQHPVIPTSIYLNTINYLADQVDHVHKYMDRLEPFIVRFIDKEYGGYSRLKATRQRLEEHGLTNFAATVEEYGLQDFFVGDFACEERRGLGRILSNIQYLVKTVIHCYTGMRDQEVLRLPYNCISQAEITPALVDTDGIVRNKAVLVDLISTTTKFTGYKAEASWLAASEVVKAIDVARAVCRSLSRFYDVSLDVAPLLISPTVLIRRDHKELASQGLGNMRLESLAKATKISPSDLVELEASAPERSFDTEASFKVGAPWPFTSHQFRRSLAFYGSSSGFISLPSLKKQFKHLTIQMSRYYANNFDQLKTVFGYYDPKTGEYVLPNNHMAYDFQTGVPISVAYDLLTEVLGSDTRLFGGVGSYVEKQRQRLDDGEVLIEDVREETLKRVEQGHISYRKTFLGACMKTGPCEAFMLGNYITCLSCPGSLIKPDRLDQAIGEAKADLEVYDLNSGEYQVVKKDLDDLVSYRERHIQAKEVI